MAIENNELVLPTLPDIAVKIQELLDDMNASAQQIVDAVSGDPVIVAQLIKTANSAAHADKPKVDNSRAAISRLGYKSLRNLV
ncbi:MAG: HDOD domain-containing protein, partial [Acidocella sp.]|nr:HDOD domain-containing protein [Acidocella sp.]